MIQLKVIPLLTCFSFVPVKHNQPKTKVIIRALRCKPTKKCSGYLKTGKVTVYPVTVGTRTIIRFKNKPFNSKLLNLFFCPNTLAGYNATVSNSGSPYQGFWNKGPWAESHERWWPFPLRTIDLNSPHINVSLAYYAEFKVHRSQKMSKAFKSHSYLRHLCVIVTIPTHTQLLSFRNICGEGHAIRLFRFLYPKPSPVYKCSIENW